MPGTRCAFALCNNSLAKAKKEGKQITFHTFPKGDARKEWVVKCRRADKFNPSTSFVCSEHFKEEDYERDLKGELLNLPLKRTLKKNR